MKGIVVACYVTAISATLEHLPSGSIAPPDLFPSRATQELMAINTSVTANQWMRAHPGDTLASFSPATQGDYVEDWCARASATDRLPDSSRVLRRAYFYAPALTSQSALPTPASPGALARRCVLGAVWVEVTATTVADAERLAKESADSITSRFHASPAEWWRDPGTLFPMGGLAVWEIKAQRAADSTIILSASETRRSRHVPRVMALAFKPISNLAPPPRKTLAERYRDDSAFLAEATEPTGFSNENVAPLMSLLARAESAYGGGLTKPDRATVRSATISTLQAWLAKAQSLDGPRRAAALLAADRLLSNSAVTYVTQADAPGQPSYDTSFYDRARALGAGMEEDKWEGMIYTRNWLDEAYETAPASRAGNLAFMSLLGGCDPAPVIEKVEDYLSSMADPMLRAQLHFTLGDAYADSVGMAGGRDLPEARAKAIDNIRAGLAIDRKSRYARAAWTKAWRLLAGLPPVQVRFHCEAD